MSRSPDQDDKYLFSALQSLKTINWFIKIIVQASPQTMNAAARTWDLDAIVDAIRAAKTRIDVHVMDYFPMFMYGENKRWAGL